MSLNIFSAIKRVVCVKYGTFRNVLKACILGTLSLYALTIMLENNNLLNNKYDVSYEYTDSKQENTLVVKDFSNIPTGNDECKPPLIGKCSNAQKSKKGNKKNKKWSSKFKPPSRYELMKNQRNQVPQLPQRVMAGESKPIKSIYSEDKIIKNITWTMVEHLRQRKIFAKRNTFVKRQCQDRKLARLQNLQAMWEGLRWTSKYHLLWCPVFKAASTTWMKNFLLTVGETEVVGSLHARVKELFPIPKGRSLKNEISKKSLKILIVRHPFERLLSAYRDKMLRVLVSSDPYEGKQKAIIKRYGTCTAENYNASDPESCSRITPATMTQQQIQTTSTTEATDLDRILYNIVKDLETPHPTFLQFLIYVENEMDNLIVKRRAPYIDSHWMPMAQSCGPCVLKYDVIAHVETLVEDQEYIIQEAGLQNILTNSHTHASRFDNFNDTLTAASEYYSQVPKSLLKNLYNLYIADFEIFGYSPDQYYKMAKNI